MNTADFWGDYRCSPVNVLHLKFWLYRKYGVMIAIGVVGSITLAIFADNAEAWKLCLTSVGALLSLAYFVQKQKLDELRLFNELFKEYNQRYADLAPKLTVIQSRPPDLSLEPDERLILTEYFNLCGEEYLMYSKGYIFPEVWQAWRNGMREYMDCDRIRAFWREELEGGSYYGLTLALT